MQNETIRTESAAVETATAKPGKPLRKPAAKAKPAPKAKATKPEALTATLDAYEPRITVARDKATAAIRSALSLATSGKFSAAAKAIRKALADTSAANARRYRKIARRFERKAGERE